MKNVLNRLLDDSAIQFKEAFIKNSIVSITDNKGTITYVNENFVKISGYPENELIGQNHRIINSGHHPKAFWSEMWKRVIKGETWTGEVKNKTKKGTFYWVMTYIIPFVDKQGNVKELLSIRSDITLEKELTESVDSLSRKVINFNENSAKVVDVSLKRLKELNTLFEEVQQVGGIGVWEADLKTGDTFWSDVVYEIHELPLDTPTNVTNGVNYYHPDHQALIGSAVEEAIKDKKPFDLELKLVTHKKRTIWVKAIGIPVVVDGIVVSTVL